MKYFNKKKYVISLILFSVLFGTSVFAADPVFKTRDAILIKETDAYVQGEFNSMDSNYSIFDQPKAWFQYGTSKNSLSKETLPFEKKQGNYLVSESIFNLKPNTRYYFRTVLEVQGEIYYGETDSFTTTNSYQSNTNVSSNTFNPGSDLNNQNALLNEFNSAANSKQAVFLDKNKNPEKDSAVEANTENTQNVNNTSNTKKPFSWSDLWPWGKKKNKKNEYNPDANLVQTKEEVAEKESIENSENDTSPQKKYSNSAANDDERGSVLQYNTGYSNGYKNTKPIVTQNQATLNYPVLLIIVAMLLVAVILIQMILRRKRRISQMQARPTSTAPNAPVRYNIPVRRDLHDPQQNPNMYQYQNPTDE